MGSSLVASRNCHRHLCSSPSEKQSSAGSANVCSGPGEEQSFAVLLEHEPRTDFRNLILEWNYRHYSHVVVMIAQHRDDHE